MLALLSVLFLDYLLILSCTNYIFFVFVWCCVLFSAYYLCLTTIFNRNTNKLSICFFFFSIFYYSFISNKCSNIYSIFYFHLFLVRFMRFFFTVFSSILQFFIFHIASVVHHVTHLLSWR